MSKNKFIEIIFAQRLESIIQSPTLLMSCNTLVLHPSIFILELLSANRQLKAIETSFTKVRLKIFEPFLFKSSLPLLKVH